MVFLVESISCSPTEDLWYSAAFSNTDLKDLLG